MTALALAGGQVDCQRIQLASHAAWSTRRSISSLSAPLHLSLSPPPPFLSIPLSLTYFLPLRARSLRLFYVSPSVCRLSVSLSLCVSLSVCLSVCLSDSLSLSNLFSLSLSLTLYHFSLFLSLSPPPLSESLINCIHSLSFILSLSLCHSLTHSLSLSHLFSLSHSLSLSLSLTLSLSH